MLIREEYKNSVIRKCISNFKYKYIVSVFLVFKETNQDLYIIAGTDLGLQIKVRLRIYKF